jgi:hypothetical protein
MSVASLATVTVGAQPALAAAPQITVSVVNGNAGTLNVVGTGFTPNSSPYLEFTQNGSNSGDLMQTFDDITTNGNGSFSVNRQAYISSVCLVGIQSYDWSKGLWANSVDLNTYFQGCTGATLSFSPCLGSCVRVAGSKFTPDSSVDLDFEIQTSTGTQWASTFMTSCGSQVPGPFPPAPAGVLNLPGAVCTGLIKRDSRFCRANRIIVHAYDELVDFAVQPFDAIVPTNC